MNEIQKCASGVVDFDRYILKAELKIRGVFLDTNTVQLRTLERICELLVLERSLVQAAIERCDDAK